MTRQQASSSLFEETVAEIQRLLPGSGRRRALPRREADGPKGDPPHIAWPARRVRRSEELGPP